MQHSLNMIWIFAAPTYCKVSIESELKLWIYELEEPGWGFIMHEMVPNGIVLVNDRIWHNKQLGIFIKVSFI